MTIFGRIIRGIRCRLDKQYADKREKRARYARIITASNSILVNTRKGLT